MKMNNLMRTIYDALDNSSFIGMPSELDGLCFDNFIIVEDCVFLSSLYAHKGNASRELFPDEVGYECFVNHVHVDEFSSDNLLAIALGFVRLLELKWKGQFIRGILRIIVSFEEGNCVVRFHLMRDKQDWLKNDLESYKNEALFVLDVPNI